MADSLDSHSGYSITVDGTKLNDKDAFLSFRVERDIFQPDHAIVELSNENSLHAGYKIGAAIEIKIGDGGGTSIFKGELTGMKPHFKGNGKSTIQLVAMNKLHRLTRGKFSKTYQ